MTLTSGAPDSSKADNTHGAALKGAALQHFFIILLLISVRGGNMKKQSADPLRGVTMLQGRHKTEDDAVASLSLIADMVADVAGLHRQLDIVGYHSLGMHRYEYSTGNYSEDCREKLEVALAEIHSNPEIQALVEEFGIEVGEITDKRNFPGQDPWQELTLLWKAPED